MFRRTYDEIIEMLIRTVLTPSVARDILRKSGFRPQAGGGPLGGLIPPGGEPGDQLWYKFSSPASPSDPTTWIPTWFKPNYLSAIEDGMPPELAKPWLGDNKPVPIFTFGTRNPDYTGIGAADRNGTVEAARIGDRAEELLVWEDVPSGFFYYPFNVEWFVTRRELNARPGQYLPREIKLRGVVVEGNPDCDLRFCHATSSSGPWTALVSADLSGGGVFNSGWVTFDEDAADDVYLGLFVDVRSSISVLHMGPIEVLMRWAPRGSLNPEDFLPS